MVCESLIKEIVGETGSGFVGLYIKGVLAGESCYLQLLASPGRGSLSRIKAPTVGTSRIQKI